MYLVSIAHSFYLYLLGSHSEYFWHMALARGLCLPILLSPVLRHRHMLPLRIETLLRVGAIVHYLQLARLVVVAVPEVQVSMGGFSVFTHLPCRTP